MKIAGEIISMVRELSRRLGHSAIDGGIHGEDDASGKSHQVPCDLMETEDSYLITMELPGVKSADVEVTVKGRKVGVQGKRLEKKLGERHAAVMVERSCGPLARIIELPSEVRPDFLRVRLESGILHVGLEKCSASVSVETPN